MAEYYKQNQCASILSLKGAENIYTLGKYMFTDKKNFPEEIEDFISKINMKAGQLYKFSSRFII